MFQTLSRSANFLEGTILLEEAEDYRILCAGIEIKLPINICRKKLIPGERVLLALKPETIQINPAKGMLKGRVDICSFQGAVTEYKILYPEGTLSVLQSNIDKRGTVYPRGTEVFLNFTPAQISVYSLSSY